MAATGIHHLFVTTHDYEATLGFWTGLGFTVLFETGHGSAHLVPPGGGTYLFVEVVPTDEPVGVGIYLDAEDDDGPWDETHWGTRVRRHHDPDGRPIWLQAVDGTAT